MPVPTAPAGLTLLLGTPRVAPGLLTAAAWEVLHEARIAARPGQAAAWAGPLGEAGLAAEEPPEDALTTPGALAAWLVDTAGEEPVVWLGSPDGDPGLTDALAAELSRRAVAAEVPPVELLAGSWDLPGARLLDLVAVMDRLRSPGGCPWDRRQTHASLLPYLLEEAHEVIEAVETGDEVHLREELGDLLLQVVFHARLAAEADEGFDVDDVAADIVAKLVRRHPHVFAPEQAQADSVEDVERIWHEQKASEKQRDSVLEGIPASLPALARAQKVLGRLAAQGLLGHGRVLPVEESRGTPDDDDPQVRLGRALLELVEQAREADLDAESALRQALRDVEQRARAVEQGTGQAPASQARRATAGD